MKRLIPVATGLLLLLFFAIAPAIAGQGTSEAEPNDTKDLADPIEGFVINGNIDDEDTDDWFVLEGQEGLQANFVIYFDDSEGLEVDFAVYSDDEEVGKAEGYGTAEAIACEIPGTCYVHVWRYEGEGDYTLKIGDPACQGESEIEPNDSREEADLIKEDLTIKGYICEEDDDWFALDGQEGQNPTFTLTFDDSGDFEVDFEIYSDDELVATGAEWDSPESLRCKVPGTCYIHVYHWEAEGEYTIEIEP